MIKKDEKNKGKEWKSECLYSTRLKQKHNTIKVSIRQNNMQQLGLLS